MNTLENRLYLSHLFDLYGKLLTKKQQLLFSLYYYDDFSMAEIAEQEGLSRQGVHDHLKRAEEKLKSIENELGFKERLMNLEGHLSDLLDLIEHDKKIDSQKKVIALLEEVTYGL